MRILDQLTSPMDRTLGPAEVTGGQNVLQASAASGIEVLVEPTAKGPASIESAHDAGFVVPQLIRLAPEAERRSVKAIIIGCYSDPGLGALREMVSIPVIGPGESSLHLAAQLGTRIGLLTSSGRGFGRVAARMRGLALGELLVSVRGVGLSVMDLAEAKSGALDKTTDAACVCMEEGADVLVLGCVSMAFLSRICETLTERLDVAVVNPVVAALKTVEALVTMRIAHSKAAWPRPNSQSII